MSLHELGKFTLWEQLYIAILVMSFIPLQLLMKEENATKRNG